MKKVRMGEGISMQELFKLYLTKKSGEQIYEND